MPSDKSTPPAWSFPLRRKTPATVMRGIAHALVAPLSSHRTFAVADYQVTVPSRSLFARQLAKYKAYEPMSSNWLISRFHGVDPGLFVDVGANFGWYSLLTARLAPSCKTIAVEPSRENFALLTRNIERNRLSNIVAVNKGAGAVATQASLYVHEQDNPGAHSIRKSSGLAAEETIVVEPLDDLLAHHDGPIHLLKVDVEGYEMDVLAGATQTLSRTRCILLEYSPDFLLELGHEPEQLLEMLRLSGYEPHRVTASGLDPISLDRLMRRDPDLAPGHRWQVDLVFIRPT